MRLYQHSARCPIALRTFLDFHPDYWCFIPLLWHEGQDENLLSLRRTSSGHSEMTNIIKMGAISNRRVNKYLDSVPLPPAIDGTGRPAGLHNSIDRSTSSSDRS
jgi:hypothetical protein